MSRKISQLAADAFILGKEFRRSGHGQTAVTIRDATFPDPRFELYLHGNCIARMEAGKLSITTARWNTVTTRDRLNALPGVSVTVHKGILYLNGKQWDGKWIDVS